MALKQRREGATRRYRFGVLVNVVAICGLATALFLGAVWFVRDLSHRSDLRFDLTRDHRYELHPLAKELLRGLEAPVRIKLVWGFDYDIYNRVPSAAPGGRPHKDLAVEYYHPLLRRIAMRVARVLSEWRRVNPRIEWELVDKEANPARAQAVAAELDATTSDVVNEVVLQLGDRRRSVGLRQLVDVQWGFFDPMNPSRRLEPYVRGAWRVQAELTATLRALVAGERTLVGVPRGLDSVYEPGSASYRAVGAVLEDAGYRLRAFDPTAGGGVPDDVDVLLLPAPRAPVPAAVMERFEAFEEGGGRILVLAHPEYPEAYRPLLEPYGLALEPEIVEDPDNSPPQVKKAEELQSSTLVSIQSIIAAPLAGRIPLYVGPTRRISVSPDRRPGATATAMLQASMHARGVRVEYPGGERHAVRVPGREKKRPRAFLALHARRPITETAREARLVVSGAAGILSPAALRSPSLGNRDLLLNVLDWLSDRPSSIGIAPREDRQARVSRPDEVAGPVTWVAVIGMPAVALIAAVVCYFVRRS